MENNYQDYSEESKYFENNSEGKPKNTSDGFQITGLVLGIIGMVGCCCGGVPSLFLGIIGLIFSIIGTKRSGSSGIGIAGIICSTISVIFGLIFVAIIAFAYATEYMF